MSYRQTITVIILAGRQFSLDSRIDLVIHNLETSHKWRHGSDTDDKLFVEQVEAIAEDVPDREGTIERYITALRNFHSYCCGPCVAICCMNSSIISIY